ncbi:uncharacterized protein LOC127831497 [Dreissena polymorpha]|uniref:uncharacterized protein LOC127831497 n=1 Tax=Dreissena polymorpha TaxID=45954 RepID=UPI0022652166|nr:uncharacterized protein LOC127831497 [Dreissena polymorpha]
MWVQGSKQLNAIVAKNGNTEHAKPVRITQKQYLAVIRGETDITFVCKPCSTSAQNGTQVGSEEVAALGNATDVMEAEDKPVNEQISTSAQNVTQAGSEEKTALGNATDVMDTEDTHVNEQDSTGQMAFIGRGILEAYSPPGCNRDYVCSMS